MAIETYEGEDYNGEHAGEDSGLPARKPGFAFRYKHHVDAWDFNEKRDRFLPLLTIFNRRPGCNGVKAGPGGDLLARTRLMEQGVTFIPYEATPDGRSYLKRHKRRGGGYLYCDRWSEPGVRGGTTRFKRDRDGFDDWRAWLVDEGHIAPPDDEAIQLIKDRLNRRLGRMAPETHNPAIEAKAEKVEDLLDAIESAPADGPGEREEWKRLGARDLIASIELGDFDDDLADIEAREAGRSKPRKSVIKAISQRAAELADG